MATIGRVDHSEPEKRYWFFKPSGPGVEIHIMIMIPNETDRILSSDRNVRIPEVSLSVHENPSLFGARPLTGTSHKPRIPGSRSIFIDTPSDDAIWSEEDIQDDPAPNVPRHVTFKSIVGGYHTLYLGAKSKNHGGNWIDIGATLHHDDGTDSHGAFMFWFGEDKYRIHCREV